MNTPKPHNVRFDIEVHQGDMAVTLKAQVELTGDSALVMFSEVTEAPDFVFEDMWRALQAVGFSMWKALRTTSVNPPPDEPPTQDEIPF